MRTGVQGAGGGSQLEQDADETRGTTVIHRADLGIEQRRLAQGQRATQDQ
jgi:hypothetical protein